MTLARKQRVVAIRYPQAQEGVDPFRASIPELVSFAHKDVLGPTIYANDVAQSGTPFDVQLKALLADERVLGNRVHWTTIRNDHPIYQAFFEFPAGPPLSTSSASRRSDRVRELEKLELRSRAVAIFADLNISYGWASTQVAGRRRTLQFGTNLLIFALAEKRAGPPRH